MPRPQSKKRQEAAQRARTLTEIDGLTKAAATRVLVNEGYYEGDRDYPSSGWITGLLRDEQRRRTSKTRQRLDEAAYREDGTPRDTGKARSESAGESAAPEEDEPGSGNGTGFEEDGDTATAWSTSARIVTLDQLLEACAVDLTVWTVDRYVVNKWEVGTKEKSGDVRISPLVQVKAWLVRRKSAPVEDALKDLIAQLGDNAPERPAPRAQLVTGEYLLVPNLYDAHVNKRSADGTYTIDRAAADFCAVADAVVARVRALGMPVERVMFPAGNDALHADNLQGTTTKGTQLELAGNQRTAIKALVKAYEYAVLRLREIAPVDVVVIESNHDRFSMAWLGEVLRALFRRTDGVTVDAEDAPRKYYRYGVTLIGLEHGDSTKPRDLAALMAMEAAHEWAATRYRQWLRGHVHHSAGMYYPISSDGGVTTRVIPALCPPDEYHVLHGFVGSHRAAEVMYFDREQGPAGEFPVFVGEVVAGA